MINNITVIEDEEGKIHCGEHEITETINTYFTTLFTSQPGKNEEIISTDITPSISTSMYERLTQEPSSKEIRDAMFSIHGNKTLGPDGFSAGFFQSN